MVQCWTVKHKNTCSRHSPDLLDLGGTQLRCFLTVPSPHLQAPSVQAQVEQHQRRVGRDRRRRRRHRRCVLVPRLPVGGHRRGSGDIGVDVDLACGATDLVGLEAAAAGTKLDTL